jgi:hypothetical protein
MATVIERTDSRIPDQELGLPTLAPTPDEWVRPEPKLDSKDSTETSISGEGADTSAKLPSSLTPPIRKSSHRLKLSGHRFEVLQQWECVILEVRDNCVYCQMHDLTDGTNPEEFAEVLISEFNEYDRPILSEGAVFYWSVGYIHRSNGQIRRSSQLRVRRMPALTTSRRTEISTRVQKLRGLLTTE